ncbi:FAD-dependent oxidoreductase [Pacificimonas flava]|uniref:FAD-dependent oxidoreductase n=2 Tax=Pacificimonas TaxID=1960290 RepID=A0A219B5X0_9SPHN|nr:MULTISPECIES: FAD-binding oxidoreductase [Pacificimonas]MBZ6379183.1 FAD-binding oxidoreductase [Pacificimonas aurantium]OWV33594.1 FAD-dependent oxidoreductase [Pacificimonas flava]
MGEPDIAPEGKVDALVIGGGLIGCAAAWHLGRAGASVLLLEAGDLNRGASGQNAGSLHFQIERRFLENGEALAEQAARVVALNNLAIEDWRGLEDALDRDLHIHMSGGLMVAETAEQARLLEAKAAREQSYGLSTRLVDGDEARSIAPYLSDAVLAASHAPDEGHADPRSLTPAFAEAAAAAGAAIALRASVTAIEPRAGGFDIDYEQGGRGHRVRTDRMLVAAGVWTPEICRLANLHMPLFPVALQMNVSERAAPFMPHLIQHVGARLSMKQAHAGNVLVGGGWPSRLRRRDGSFDLAARPDLRPENLAPNLAVAARLVPELAELNLIRTWTGKTAVSADQLPIAGEVPSMPGFWVAGGGSAFTLGPTLARLVAEEMGGERQDALQVVSPARFEHLNSFMG